MHFQAYVVEDNKQLILEGQHHVVVRTLGKEAFSQSQKQVMAVAGRLLGPLCLRVVVLPCACDLSAPGLSPLCSIFSILREGLVALAGLQRAASALASGYGVRGIHYMPSLSEFPSLATVYVFSPDG